jgi:hypothetical protein
MQQIKENNPIMAAGSGFIVAKPEQRVPDRIRIGVPPAGRALGSTRSGHGSTRMPVQTEGR